MRSNYEGPASILAVLANRFEERGSGTLVGISSVAGERGRATNYVYGSAKAGFTAFLSGLRNRLATRGVHVVTVLPGFVATQMTEGMDLPAKADGPTERGGRCHRARCRTREGRDLRAPDLAPDHADHPEHSGAGFQGDEDMKLGHLDKSRFSTVLERHPAPVSATRPRAQADLRL